MADYQTKGSFNLGNQITLKNKNSNIDRDYGPYEGKTLAEVAALLTDTIQIGKTIGVMESGKVVEYWWQPEGDGYAFVKKGGGSEIVVDSTLNNESSNPIANKAVANQFYTLEQDLKGDIEAKANQSEVDSIDTRVGALETTITSKAEQSAVEALQTAVGNKADKVAKQEVSGDQTISPNTMYVWGSVTALTITKGTDIAGIVNNYMIRFTAGEGCAVKFSGFELDWFGGEEPSWTAGNTYEISIVDNIALFAEFEA